ncbi:asparaginase, partial [Acinetobacter baumannii]|nr:asparaginase [Acinetobacter baumannii]
MIPPHLTVHCFAAPNIVDSSACTAPDWLRLIQRIQQLQ